MTVYEWISVNLCIILYVLYVQSTTMCIHTYMTLQLSCDMVLCTLQLEAELIVELLKDYPEAKAWVCFNCKVSQFSGCMHECVHMCLTHGIKLLYNSYHLPVLHSLAECCYLRMTANFFFVI